MHPYIELTTRLLRRHLNHHRTYFYTIVTTYRAPTKKSEIGTHKKERHPTFEPLTLRYHGQRPTCYPTMILICIHRDWYLPTSTNGRFDICRKNVNRTRCRGTTRARPRPPPAESGVTSKVRHVEQTPHRMVGFVSS